MYMEKDDVCLNGQTRQLAARIRTNAGEVIFKDEKPEDNYDHYYPAHANDKKFME